MNKQHFTLIELLMAIAIIVILAAIAIPVTTSAIKKAETAKAQAEMTTLVNALKSYETTYGILPLKCFTEGTDDKTLKDDDAYEKLIRILQGENLEISSKKMNARKIAFLEVQGNTEGEFTDPWGNNYAILIDTTGDGKIKVADADWPHGLDKPSNGILHKDIVIWSKGADGASDATADDDKNADNVFSIPVLWDKANGTWSSETH